MLIGALAIRCCHRSGSQGVAITNNTFTKLDTNAVFLSGYNQHTAVVQNDFRWLGQSAIASWGRPVDNDGTNGEFPRYTLIEANWCHSIGHQQKQSSFYFQAETAEVRQLGRGKWAQFHASLSSIPPRTHTHTHIHPVWSYGY